MSVQKTISPVNHRRRITEADSTASATIVAAWAETVPKRPLTASTGTWTVQSPGVPAMRSARSESGAISIPSSEGVNIGRQRGSKPGSRSPSRPLPLKMPETMSERASAATISTVNTMTLRHPPRRQTSQRISAYRGSHIAVPETVSIRRSMKGPPSKFRSRNS